MEKIREFVAFVFCNVSDQSVRQYKKAINQKCKRSGNDDKKWQILIPRIRYRNRIVLVFPLKEKKGKCDSDASADD
jgi:hypothetical protein